jgi:isopenicillin-N epimerase
MGSTRGNAAGGADWNEIRAQILMQPGVAYLNTGSYGLTPRPVFEQWMRDREALAREPVDFLWRQTPARLSDTRRRLADFVGADPRSIVFMPNVTAALNTVAWGLQAIPRRVLALTDQEYGAMQWLWEEVARRHDWELRWLVLPRGEQVTRQEILDVFDRHLDQHVGLLFVSHISYVTGLVLPVHEICQLARERGVLSVVDGAHGPGHVELQLDRMGCDFYAGNCHKWLLAPIGSAFLYVRPGNEDLLVPTVVSWGWHVCARRRHEPDRHGSTPWIRAFEFQGTRDVCPWLAVATAVEFLADVGFADARKRIQTLAALAREWLAPYGWLRPLTPTDRDLASGLTSFSLPEPIDPEELQQFLWERFRVEVPAWRSLIGSVLRVSTHYYNSEEDLERLAYGLKVYVGQTPGVD